MAKLTSAKVETTYTLEVSQKEAEALVAVLARVAGDPQSSPRAYMQNIYELFEREGVAYGSSPAYHLLEGSLKFRTYPTGKATI